jgi:hypothetical protein
MLPDKQDGLSGWQPAQPLILGAWWDTPASAKRLRLREHLEYAETHGVLARIDAFLRGLPEAEWAHLDDF